MLQDLVPIVVPIFVCVILPVAIVAIVFWAQVRNRRQKSQVIMEALKHSDSVDINRLAKLLGDNGNITTPRRRQVRHECALAPAEQHPAAEGADDSFRYQALYHAMARLPERERMAIALYYLQGYSTEEISRILDINASNTRQILSRARAHLRMELNKNI